MGKERGEGEEEKNTSDCVGKRKQMSMGKKTHIREEERRRERTVTEEKNGQDVASINGQEYVFVLKRIDY